MSSAGNMPYRTLGRTGEQVSLIGLGGFHLGRPTEQEAVRIVRTALDNGVTFLDNSWDYNEGQSEIRMGKALKDGYRERAFVMTKIDARTKQVAAQQIEESLRRLQVDTIDLLQFHEVIRPHDADLVFAPDGAIEAALDAKKAGKIRYIGFTGHKDPDIHLRMLNTAFARGFTFDTVQMPLNVMDPHFRSFEKQILPVLVQHQIGVLGMKPMGDAIFLRSQVVSPIECLHEGRRAVSEREAGAPETDDAPLHSLRCHRAAGSVSAAHQPGDRAYDGRLSAIRHRENKQSSG